MYYQKRIRSIYRRRRDENILRLIFAIFILLLIISTQYPVQREDFRTREINSLLKNIKSVLIRNGFTEIELNKKYMSDNQISLAFKYPEKLNERNIIEFITAFTHQGKFCVNRVVNLPRDAGFIICIDHLKREAVNIFFVKREDSYSINLIYKHSSLRPILAIIIDDFGYSNNEVIKGFIELEEDITVSIIPGHRFTRWTATEAVKRGKEILIHMPMESEKHINEEERYLLRVNLSHKKIQEMIDSAYSELPVAAGMSNHMGSLFTSDKDAMKVVINNLKHKGLYFIDSLTSPKSVAFEVARESGIPTATRSVFLDNNRDKKEIRLQFEKAVDIAKRRGKSIAIGHVYPETLEVLKELIRDGFFSEVQILPFSFVVS